MGSNESVLDQKLDSNIYYETSKYIPKKMSDLSRINIIIVGKTGVGKSTLINSFFNEKLAQTGTGRPITNLIEPYSTKNSKFTIYDTPGLELRRSQQNFVKNEIFQIILSRSKTIDVSQKIHFIWYCISAASSRIEDAEIEFIKLFTSDSALNNIQIIIILTKSYFLNDIIELEEEIAKLNINYLKIIPILAKKKEDKIPFGIDNLKNTMMNCPLNKNTYK